MENEGNSNFLQNEAMNLELEYIYQKSLIFASLDGVTLYDAMDSYAGGQYASNNQKWWRESVIWVYKNLSTGLIELEEPVAKTLNLNPQELARFIYSKDPNGIDTSCILYANYYATDRLIKIVKKHSLHNWDSWSNPLNKEFIADLKSIYYELEMDLIL